MKKILGLLSVMFLAACTKVNNVSTVSFSIPYTQTITIPAISGYPYGTPIPGGSLAIPTIPVTVSINPQQSLDYYTLGKPVIISAMLSNMNMQIITPDTGNFNFLNDIQLSIIKGFQAEDLPSSGNILVAFENNIPLGQKTLSLIIEPDVNLENYAINDSITVQVNVAINAVPPPDTQITISGNINITVNSL